MAVKIIPQYTALFPLCFSGSTSIHPMVIDLFLIPKSPLPKNTTDKIKTPRVINIRGMFNCSKLGCGAGALGDYFRLITNPSLTDSSKPKFL